LLLQPIERERRAAWITGVYVRKWGGGEEISKILTVSSLYDFYQIPTLEYKKVDKNTGEVYSSVSDPHPDQLGRRIRIRIGNPDLYPGRPKLSHKKGKNEEISYCTILL
jgi:hypothetical protein